jgi:hypothetical protein
LRLLEENSPCKKCVSSFGLYRHRERERLSTNWTPADDALDDLECITAIFGNRRLAGPAAVHGTSFHCKALDRTRFPGLPSGGTGKVVVGLARKVVGERGHVVEVITSVSRMI